MASERREDAESLRAHTEMMSPPAPYPLLPPSLIRPPPPPPPPLPPAPPAEKMSPGHIFGRQRENREGVGAEIAATGQS